MKTIEEKAKAYDEALEGVQEILSSGADSIKMSRLQLRLQGIFPELKELEDERIRKTLIRYFTLSDEHAYNEACGVSYRDIVAWLEKQGSKPQGKTALEAANEEKVDNSNKVEKKFKPGDWIIHQGTGNVYQVTACIDNQYQLKYGDAYTIQKCDDVDRHARLLDAAKDLR